MGELAPTTASSLCAASVDIHLAADAAAAAAQGEPTCIFPGIVRSWRDLAHYGISGTYTSDSHLASLCLYCCARANILDFQKRLQVEGLYGRGAGRCWLPTSQQLSCRPGYHTITNASALACRWDCSLESCYHRHVRYMKHIASKTRVRREEDDSNHRPCGSSQVGATIPTTSKSTPHAKSSATKYARCGGSRGPMAATGGKMAFFPPRLR